ncbi:hypothetical protein GTA08_BOTSDO09443 [Botryosphaeria dothidea]|uniref:Uncharacterized protein n=1 Tax=Botryosphaeria dothidea TaxID=55169 RepID=A0A8H4IM52_9PEZI|nr:hypothetical protein GTA08_BOTSDO09443 [Botryosphaeria dothidea]
MADTAPTAIAERNYSSDASSAEGQARGGRRPKNVALSRPAAETLPTPPQSSSLSQPAGKPFDSTILMDMYPTGQLLKGAVDAEGNQKDAALLVGIKLDLEAEIHLTARVRGDIAVGLY